MPPYLKKILSAALWLASSAFCAAQVSPAPSIAYVYPAGGQAGKTFKIVIGGRDFKDASQIIFSGTGVSGKILNVTIPFTQGQVPGLRFKLERKYIEEHPGAREKVESMGKDGQAWLRKVTMEIKENAEQLAEADASYYLRLVSSDAMADTVEAEITIDADAEPSRRNVWIMTPEGLSNPMVFEIDTLPEVSKPSLRETAYFRARLPEYWGKAAGKFRWAKNYVEPQKPEIYKVNLPVIANGQITEAHTDTYSFEARKGCRIIFDARAQSLIPYISDAVPGWFQTVLTVRDPDGREVAYDDDYFFHPDSFISFLVPKDGVYTVEIRDSIYRSREDFVYRLYMGELPSLDKSAAAPIPADGKNAPPQNIKVPSETRGVIRKIGQVDSYVFNLIRGERVVAEIFARRDGSPLDSYLILSDSAGKTLAESDDFEDLSYGLVTHHADSRLEFVAPADGAYALRVGDISRQASGAHSYRLLVTPPKADFAARAVPSAINILPGGYAGFTVKIFRRDSLKYPVKILAKDLPEGWKFIGSVIPADKDSGEFLLKAPMSKELAVISPTFTASAEIDGKKTERPVVPCQDMMQAFYYRHLVPSSEFKVCVTADWPAAKMARNMQVSIDDLKKPVAIPESGLFNLRIGNSAPKAPVWRIAPEIRGCDFLKAQKLFEYKGGLYVEINCDAAKGKIGARGTFDISLPLKQGKNLVSFNRVPPVDFVIVRPPPPAAKKAEEQKAEQTKQAVEQKSKDADAKKSKKKKSGV